MGNLWKRTEAHGQAYEGGETFGSKTVKQGAAYGTLPTPAARAGYNFICWTLEDGTEVNENTTVSVDHTLYAKWEIVPDTNPVVVGSVTNGVKTVDYVDGKHIYKYTTRGVENPGTGNLARTVGISFPASQTHVAVEFRFTESFKSDGTNELAPYLGVYWAGSGNSSTGNIAAIWIYDANGALVSRNNDKAALNVEQWYTLVVNMRAGTNFTMCPIHHYSGEGAPVLTMEIRDRGTYTAPGTFTTAWDAMPDPVLHYVDGNFQYDIIGNAATATGDQRQMNLTLSTDGMTHVMYEVMVENPTGGASATITSSYTVFYDMETGAVVTSFEEGKWYGAVYSTGKNLGTERLHMGNTGSNNSATGGIDVHIRNLRVYAESANTVGPFVHYNERNWGALYRTGEDSWQWANKMVNGTHPGFSQRSIEIRNPLDTPAVLKANVKFKYCTDVSGNAIAPNIYAYDGSTISDQKSEFIVIDPDTGKIASALECNKTYTIYVMADANAVAYLKVCLGAASGVQTAVEISGCEALPYTAPAVKMAANATAYGNMGLYKSGDEWIYGYAHSTGIHTASTDYRKIQVYLGGTTYTQLQFTFKYQEATNNGTHFSAMDLSAGTLAITDLNGNPTAVASMEADTWYIATVSAASGSTLPDNFQIYTMGKSIAGSAESPIHIKMVIKDLQAS